MAQKNYCSHNIWKSSCDLTLFVSVFPDSAVSCKNIPDIAKSGFFEHLLVSYVLDESDTVASILDKLISGSKIALASLKLLF